ncbi:hypothetical protein EJB05_57778, partial [Eragrostis curvula]
MDGAACCKSGGGGANTPDKLSRSTGATAPTPASSRRSPMRKNRFCPTCLVGLSGRRCPNAQSHAGGQGADAIEIHVRGEGDSERAFVDVMQIHGLFEYDCSEIKQEMELASPPTLLRRLVPLHPPNDQANEYCGSIRIGNGSLYCSMECEVQWRADKGAPGYQFVEALLAEDFTTRYELDAFCTTCRVAFCTAICGDHADHPSVKITTIGDGWLFVQVPAMEKWLGNFAFVPDGEEGYRLLPLTPPPTPGCKCECYMIGSYLWFCSIQCLGPTYSHEISKKCTRRMEPPAYLATVTILHADELEESEDSEPPPSDDNNDDDSDTQGNCQPENDLNNDAMINAPTENKEFTVTTPATEEDENSQESAPPHAENATPKPTAFVPPPPAPSVVVQTESMIALVAPPTTTRGPARAPPRAPPRRQNMNSAAASQRRQMPPQMLRRSPRLAMIEGPNYVLIVNRAMTRKRLQKEGSTSSRASEDSDAELSDNEVYVMQ